VPWGDERTPGHPDEPPWPGRLPPPAPATVLPQPLTATVVTADGALVGVTGRLAMTGMPARLTIGTGPAVNVVGWAGPWPADERWWAPAEAGRRVRFQMLLADGQALLMALAGGHWVLEAIYD
jgi:protein ImuB